MGTEIIHQLTEEEWQYNIKNEELSRLETQLTQQELELATILGEINSFRARYLAAVGSRYWELDKLEAEIAEIEARRKPYDQGARQKAEQARAQAEESAKAANNRDKVKERVSRFKPTENLKKLYRQIAKKIHPDLAVNDQERTMYQQLMTKANQAYQVGDEIGLQNILKQLRKSSISEKIDTIINKLAQIIRQITQVKERLSVIERELKEIRNSSLYKLKLKVETAENNGSDLLAEMARFLDEQIAAAKVNLALVKTMKSN
jgi:chromosome segregation ATPase